MTDNADTGRRRHPADARGELGISVEITEHRGVLLATLHGAIDFWNAGLLQEKLHNALQTGATRLVLDLGQVTFMDSTGLGLLLSLDDRTAAQNGWLRLANPQPPVRRVLQTTMLDERLQLYPTVEAAIGRSAAS